MSFFDDINDILHESESTWSIVKLWFWLAVISEVRAWRAGIRSFRTRVSDWWYGFSHRRTWALSTARGRGALAMAMAVPIRRVLDYQSVARKILFVDELPQGALARYDIVDRAAKLATDAIQAEEDGAVMRQLLMAA